MISYICIDEGGGIKVASIRKILRTPLEYSTNISVGIGISTTLTIFTQKTAGFLILLYLL